MGCAGRNGVAEVLVDPRAILRWVEDPSPWTPEDYMIDHDLCRQVMVVLEKLSKRQADVLRRRFGIGEPEQTLHAIGRDLGVCGARVRQIEAAALRKLRQPQCGRYLRAFVDP